MIVEAIKKTLAIPKRVVMAVIRLYQKTFSPDHGWCRVFFPFGCCRFHPTCSQYAHEAIDEHGLVLGLWLGLWRLMRCHPWSKGGHDPVPKKDRK